MFFYYIPLLLCAIGSFLKMPLYRKLFLFFICFYLFFILAFKGSVDPDYSNYQFLLENSPTFDDGLAGINAFSRDYGFEIGLTLLNTTLNSLGVGLYFFYSFFAFIAVLCIYKISLKNNNSFLVFSLLYVMSFIGLWVQVRFGLACLLSLLASLIYFEGRKKLSFFLFLSSLIFHNITFSLIIPVFIFLFFNKIGFRKDYILYVLMLFSVFLFFDLSWLLELVLIFFNTRYEAYFFEDTGSVSSYYIRLCFFIAMLILIKKNLFDIGGRDKFLLSMVVSSVLIFIFASQITIFYRLGVFLELGYIFFLNRYIYVSKYNYIFGVFVIILMLFYRIHDSLGEVKPYFSVLF